MDADIEDQKAQITGLDLEQKKLIDTLPITLERLKTQEDRLCSRLTLGVEAGQEVEIKLETFPFTRFGLIPGRVKQLGRDVIQDKKKGPVYKAEVTLKADKILVGSKWVPLAPGMAMQAEIKTGDRRVIEYFLSPFLRYRDEALRER